MTLENIDASHPDYNTVSFANGCGPSVIFGTSSKDNTPTIGTTSDRIEESCVVLLDIKSVIDLAEKCYYKCMPLHGCDEDDPRLTASLQLGSLIRVAKAQMKLLMEELDSIGNAAFRADN